MEDRSLGAILLENSSLSQEQLDEALKVQKEKGFRLGDALIQLKYLRSEDILKALSIQLGMPYANKIEADEIPLELASQVSLNYAKNHEVIPLERTAAKVRVAMADPFDHYTIDDLRVLFGCTIEPKIASSYEIISAINVVYNKISEVQGEGVNELQDENLDSIGQEMEEVQDLLESGDEAPIIRLVNSLLFRAVKQQASDMHIEPFEKELLVRFRVDGVLYDIMRPPKKAMAAIISRIKIMANLNIAEKRLPQDGRIRIKVAGKDVDIRVSSVPTAYGESIVMRLLDKSKGILDLDKIGISERVLDKLKELITRPHGIILVTGPTGSGKTTTLYAALSRINTIDKKILTTEDPVEYQIDGINQIPVNASIGLTFAAGLRSILRQDPDVVMVGEIRDAETAEIAVQASLTGHLVFSTLHTNDAPSSATRICDMGIEPFLVSSSVIAIIAQRLVRTVCKDCAKKYTPTEEQLAEMGKTLKDLKGRQLYKAVGCSNCIETGYVGRTGIHELMIMDDALRAQLMKSTEATQLKKLAVERGMWTLRDDGVDKAIRGETTLEEVFRVTAEEAVEEDPSITAA